MTIDTQTLLTGFDVQPRIRLVFGVDRAAHIAQYVRDCGGARVLLVTDPGIVKAGHAERIEHRLREEGIVVTRFDDVIENPTTTCVENCTEVARAANIDLIIGLGGGSSLDTAKGCNFLLTNGGRMQDYWGKGKAQHPMLPLIAIPTTAGTGSECQSFALISDAETHAKMACGDPKAAPRISVLDPMLTLTQPPQVTALTGIDALTHATETAVCNQRTPYSWLYSREAFRLVQLCLPRVLAAPDDLEARSGMLLGAAYAGTAIEASMLGAAHALANPLTANHDVVHGQAVGMMLPHVVRYNGENQQTAGLYQELAAFAGLCPHDATPDLAVEALALRIESILDQAGIPRTLAEAKIERPNLGRLAEQAAQQWTGRFNPRSLQPTDFEDLYRRAS